MQSTLRILFCTALVVLTGCRSEPIREYSVAREPAPAVPPSAGRATGSETPSVVERPEWTLPASWRERPGDGVRFATLVVDRGSPPLEIRITPLSLAASDPLGNVNRWRGQIGLPPVTREELPHVLRSERINARTADLLDMVGPGADGQPAIRMLAAILPGDESVWFFLLTGPADRVDKYVEDFGRFIHSVRLGARPAMAAMPSDHPPVEGMPSDHPPLGMPQDNAGAGAPSSEMTWVLPAAWRPAPSSSSFRVGTFQFADGAQSGEVAITRFPGGAGGMLENINRWRGQLGLPPAGTIQEQPMQRVKVAGIESARIDLVAASGDTGTRMRMVVVSLPRSDITYFIKMTGPISLLDNHIKDFDVFLQSVRFPKARS